MDKEQEYLIKNEKLKQSLDLTKSALQDVCTYLNKFEPLEDEPVETQLERYKKLVEVLKDVTFAFNDKYANKVNCDNVYFEDVPEWKSPDDPKEKVEYLRSNLSLYMAKYKLCKEANKNRKEGQPYKYVGFRQDELRRFVKDCKDLELIFSTQLNNYYDAYKSFYIANTSLQEYADAHFDKNKRKAQILSDKMKSELEKVFVDLEKTEVKDAACEKSKEKLQRISKLYDEAENKAIQKMIEYGADESSYYDFYKEEMQKVDKLLEDEDWDKPYSKQNRIADLNKVYGHKDWKSIDGKGNVTHNSSEVHDVEGDNEYINNKIFKKKK